MNDRTITLTPDEIQEVEAALEDRLTNLGRAAEERALSRPGDGLQARDLVRKDTRSALEKVRSA